MIQVGRSQARRVLLMQSNRELEDMGISRHLLLEGVKSWPWRDGEQQNTVEQPLPVQVPTRAQRRDEKRAIRELQALSNAELQDMGISRGGIVDAVRHGRRDDQERSPIVPRKLRETLQNVNTKAVNTPSLASNETDDKPPQAPLSGGTKQVA